ncbi:MAG: glycosyltransferase [Actinomycetota bacterium]|nr:glycosyltransferase [Actinomycetota bacterium]
MNILFVVKEFPHSRVIGGPIIIFNRIKYLSSRHTVSCIAFTPHELTPEQIESLSVYCKDLRLVPTVKRSLPKRLYDYFFGPVPPYFMQARSEKMFEGIREMVRSIKYDVVISEYSMVAQYLFKNPDLAGIKRVMSVHECYYLARRRAWEVKGFSREGLSSLANLKGLKDFEMEMYADADKILVLTSEGKEELLSLKPDLDISVVPHGVDVEKFRPAAKEQGSPTVMFLGNFMHEPNSDAVIYFYEHIWPQVKRKVKDARFLVVGRGPTEEMLAIAQKDSSIVITGEVADVRPFFPKSDVFVCPVRMGGGFRGKVLEAMASGIPVVSTKLGAEGLPASNFENIILSDEPEDFAKSVVLLMQDESLSRKIADSARRLVVDNFSWQKGVEILEEVLRGQVLQ